MRLIKNLLLSINDMDLDTEIGPLARRMAITVCMFPSSVVWDFLRINKTEALKLRERIFFDECYCADDLTPLRVKIWLEEIRRDYPSGVIRVLNQMLARFWRDMARKSKARSKRKTPQKSEVEATVEGQAQGARRRLDMEVPVEQASPPENAHADPPLEMDKEDTEYVHVDPVLEEVEEPYVEVDEKAIHDILFPEMEYEPQEVADARDVQYLFED